MARRKYFCRSVRTDFMEIDNEPDSDGQYRVSVEGASVYLSPAAMLNLREFLAGCSVSPEWEDVD